ncbi:hypothetical protein BurMR1_3064 [Burkholderia sp. MR1]|nr:hypothetical protein BurMR1_3064 [Burkholderia sp. MR1]
MNYGNLIETRSLEILLGNESDQLCSFGSFIANFSQEDSAELVAKVVYITVVRAKASMRLPHRPSIEELETLFDRTFNEMKQPMAYADVGRLVEMYQIARKAADSLVNNPTFRRYRSFDRAHRKLNGLSVSIRTPDWSPMDLWSRNGMPIKFD